LIFLIILEQMAWGFFMVAIPAPTMNVGIETFIVSTLQVAWSAPKAWVRAELQQRLSKG
jgi:hypothetical protein